METKSIYTNQNIVPQAILGITSIAIIAISIYLTGHFYDSLFPVTLEGSSLCDINKFFNCDHTLNSPLSNILGVPISLFGILYGVFLLIGFPLQSKTVEGTNHILSVANFFLCIFLLLYSLIALNGLCPGCVLYYSLSIFVSIIFYKYSNIKKFDFKIFGKYLLSGIVISVIAILYSNSRKSDQNILSKSLIPMYNKLEYVGEPSIKSPYLITSSTKLFSDGVIRITKFSDYQCPGCKVAAKMLEKAAQKYKGKINIQYIFFPLDKACNHTLKTDLHIHACKAAYLASCLPNKFEEISSKLFKNQYTMNDKWLTELAKSYGVFECMNKKETMEKIIEHINIGDDFNITGTPTIIINGKKITRLLPLNQLYIILDSLLKK